MKKPKISVIVAVYNTERYLERCLKSLLDQTYKNLEIIIIEDKSTDASNKILKKYEKFNNIKIVYNKENKGLSYSRNVGLRKATGDYIGYVDSDDYVDNDYYEKLMKAILDKRADIAIGDIKIVYEATKMEYISKCYSGEEFNVYSVINNGLAASACNKLFKRELIERYSFAEGKVNEDIAVIIPVLINANKICYTEKCYYYYIQRDNSIQNSDFSNKRFDIFDGVKLTLERIKGCKNYNDIKDALIFNQLVCLLLYVIPKEKNLIYRRKILKKFNMLSKNYNIRQNHCFWNFLEQCGKKHCIYYKLLLKFVCTGNYTLANLLILAYDTFSVIFKRKKIIKENVTMQELIDLAKKQKCKKHGELKISVIVPNYNYARFMYERLYSILSQDYPIYELIILDDCSKDESKKVIDDISKQLEKYIKIKTIYNDENSGSAFKQWKKGFDNAAGDYIWIAEADDYCESNLLSNIIKPCICDNDVVISYADTAFIDIMGNVIVKTIKSEIDIQKSGHWNKSYVNTGMNEIENYSYLNCTIANVSSCIIKNGDYTEFLNESGNYHQAGDWIFYVNLMSTGKIAYTDRVLNYYRLHGNNVSSTMNKQKHIDEIKRIHLYYLEKFQLGKKQKSKMKERVDFLKKMWKVD